MMWDWGSFLVGMFTGGLIGVLSACLVGVQRNEEVKKILEDERNEQQLDDCGRNRKEDRPR